MDDRLRLRGHRAVIVGWLGIGTDGVNHLRSVRHISERGVAAVEIPCRPWKLLNKTSFLIT